MLVHNFPKSFISPHLKVFYLEISKGIGELQPSVLDTRELKQRREIDGNENVKKPIGLDWQNNDSACGSRCWYISFSSCTTST